MTDEPKPINHGTYGGAQTHKKRREPMCGACADAAAAYMRKLRARRADIRRGDRERNRAAQYARTRLVEKYRAEYEELYRAKLAEIHQKRGMT